MPLYLQFQAIRCSIVRRAPVRIQMSGVRASVRAADSSLVSAGGLPGVLRRVCGKTDLVVCGQLGIVTSGERGLRAEAQREAERQTGFRQAESPDRPSAPALSLPDRRLVAQLQRS